MARKASILRKPKIQTAYLKALETGLSIKKAAKAAGTTSERIAVWRRENPMFDLDHEIAYSIGADELIAEARRRAVDGVREYLYHAGRPVIDPRTGEQAYNLKYSDRMLEMLLAARDPEMFCPRVRAAKKLRQWAKFDAMNGDGSTTPLEAALQAIEDMIAMKAAMA